MLPNTYVSSISISVFFSKLFSPKISLTAFFITMNICAKMLGAHPSSRKTDLAKKQLLIQVNKSSYLKLRSQDDDGITEGNPPW